jgi:hypothetical protein
MHTTWHSRCFVLVGLAAFSVSLAQAQATRTWVSGVGDDANPCSRTAPCKTFAGAISKTAPSGEINVLDPGGFGGVTITKAITIDGGGFIAGVLVSGTNGIVVQAGATDTVILRGLDIDGLGTGIDGIRFLTGKALLVDDCRIYGFATRGISVEPSDNAHVVITRTQVYQNFDGIFITPNAAVVTVTIDGSDVSNNQNYGVNVFVNGTASIRNSVIAHNGLTGLRTEGLPSTAYADNVSIFDNLYGIGAVSQSNVVLTNSTIMLNQTGLITAGSAGIFSFGNNHISGNLSGNGPVTAVLSQQ